MRRGRREEKDDDRVDVPHDDGNPELRRRGTLKNEAKEMRHLLTHRYKNPYCDACVRAKMKHFKTYRGAFKRELKKFGDLITFDFVDTAKVHDQGILLETEVLVIRDRYTGLIGAYPSQRKTTEDVVRAVKRFMGRYRIREAHGDKAPRFEKAMGELKIPYDHALPGRAQSNSLAERNNQCIIVATTTCILQAGLPPCFWRAAIECVCHLLNIEPIMDEVSSWTKFHDQEFGGEAIPFGAAVSFKPSGARVLSQNHKFDPDAIPGVFAGYQIGVGFKWTGQYRVWALEDFTKQNLAYDAERPCEKLRMPHLTQKIVLKFPLEFPCKERYEKINTTLEGLTDKDRLEGSREMIEDRRDDDGEEGDDDDFLGGDDNEAPKSKILH